MFYFEHDRTMPVNVLVGCFTMVRREAFDAVGLMDESLFMYGDDVDWCTRAWSMGWHVVFFPGARAIHDHGKITAPYPVRFAVAQQKSILYYWSKHRSLFGVLGIRGIMLVHHLIRYCLAALPKFKYSDKRNVHKAVSSACLRELIWGMHEEGS